MIRCVRVLVVVACFVGSAGVAAADDRVEPYAGVGAATRLDFVGGPAAMGSIDLGLSLSPRLAVELGFARVSFASSSDFAPQNRWLARARFRPTAGRLSLAAGVEYGDLDGCIAICDAYSDAVWLDTEVSYGIALGSGDSVVLRARLELSTLVGAREVLYYDSASETRPSSPSRFPPHVAAGLALVIRWPRAAAPSAH